MSTMNSEKMEAPQERADVRDVRVVRLDLAAGGRTFEGIGGITSNGMSKLLLDYPEAVRQEILELLFKPNYGAGLQHLKVEIGSDVNTSCGTEPSHKRSRDDYDIRRGAGLRIARMAKDIRPGLLLDALRWGTPRWIENYDDKLDYYLSFLKGAKEEFGLEFDYLGPDINEGAFDRDWTVDVLRPALDREGFASVRLVADDSDHGWDIADRAETDPHLFKAVHAYAVHYRQDSTPSARASGKPLWLSEDLAPFRHRFTSGGLHIAKRIVDMYAVGRMVKYELHPLLEAEYNNTPFNYKGILAATWPWSGHYEVDPGLWVVAHFTQFAQPGWTFADSGCVSADDGGCVTLLAPDGSGNYSFVLVNTSPDVRFYRFQAAAVLSTSKPVQVWRTNEREQFIRLEPMAWSIAGELEIAVEPLSVYTLTSTTGQRKGTDTVVIVPETEFPLPFADDWMTSREGGLPLYTSDQGGAFELTEAEGQVCLRQNIGSHQIPLDWTYRSTPEPYTLLGSLEWTDYRVSVQVQVGSADGYAGLAGRVSHTDKSAAPPSGYRFLIRPSGAYELWAGRSLLAHGRTAAFAAQDWHRLELVFAGDTVEAYWGEAQEPLVSVRDGRQPAGQIAVFSGYHPAQFRLLRIEPVAGQESTASCRRYDDRDPALSFSGEWVLKEGDFNVYARSVHRTDAAGAALAFTFNGESVRIVGCTGEDGGMADVFIDGEYRGTLDAYRPKAGFRESLFAVHGLSAERTHALQLVVTGKRRQLSSGSFVSVDAVEIAGGTGLSAGGE